MDIAQRLSQYILAVESNDLEVIEDFYDTDFVTDRYDRSGALVTLDRATSITYGRHRQGSSR